MAGGESTGSDRRRPQAEARGGQGTAAAMPSFGERLRRERESRGKAIEEIVRATEIDPCYFEALERDEFDTFPGPGPGFGKFFIRAYAEAVGLDPQPLIEDYDREYHKKMRERAAVRAAAADERTGGGESRRVPVVPRAAAVATASPATTTTPAAPTQPRPVVSRPTTAFRRLASAPLLRPAGLLIVVGLLVAAVSYAVFFRTGDATLEPATPVAGPTEAPHESQAPPVETPAPAPARLRTSVPRTEPGAVAATTAARLRVSEFGVGRGIVDRRLEGRTDRFEEGSVAWFSTRVLGGRPGDRVRHVWLREGRAVQSIELEIGGPHWRTYSHKTLWRRGRWTVEARDAADRVLAAASFTCVAAGS